MSRAPQESDSLLRFRKDAPRHYWRCYVECPDCGGVGMRVSKYVDENGYPMSERGCITCNGNGFLHDYGWRDRLATLGAARSTYLRSRGGAEGGGADQERRRGRYLTRTPLNLKTNQENTMTRPLYIFDLDGTLSNADHRKHLLADVEDSTRWRRFYAACGGDSPVGAVIALFNLLRLTGNDVMIWTGRSDEVAAITVEWLANNTSLMTHDVPSVIRMREAADHTPDDKLKKRWLDEMHWGDRSRIVAVFEDRARVVAMWRAAGIPCFQVADGDF